MNNTHYVLINEDNEVVAVVKKENYKGRLIKAIEDETGGEVEIVTIEQIEYNSFKVSSKLLGYENEYVTILRPTWEY